MLNFRIIVALVVLVVSPPAAAHLWPTAGERVKTLLESDSLESRRRGARELLALPRVSASRGVAIALADPDLQVRLAAVLAAERYGLESTSATLRGWLASGRGAERLAAARWFAHHPDPRLANELGRLSLDRDVRVRRHAVRALARIETSIAMDALISAVSDADAEVQRLAAEALGHRRVQRGVIALLALLHSDEWRVRFAALRALGRIGDASVAQSVGLLLGDSAVGVRREAAVAVARLGNATALAERLPLEEVPEVRAALLAGLARLRPDDVVALVVRPLMRRPLEPGLARAIWPAVLGEAPAAVAPLSQCVDGAGNDSRLVVACAQALAEGGIAGGAQAIVRALERGAIPRTLGLPMLARLAEPSTLSTAIRALDDPDPRVWRAAVAAAGATLDAGGADGRVVGPVTPLLGQAQPREKLLALLALLGKSRAASAASVVAPFVSRQTPLDVRRVAVRALGMLGPSRYAALLVPALAEPSGALRWAASTSLRRIGGERECQRLISALAAGAVVDRAASLNALAGAAGRCQSRETESAAWAQLETSVWAERGDWIEAVGRWGGGRSARRLLEWARRSRSEGERAKAVEVLGGLPRAESMLAEFSQDSATRVRAQLAWSLGDTGQAAALPAIERLMRDDAAEVAGNAVAAWARVVAGTSPRWPGATAGQALCVAVKDPRPEVRSNAVAALAILRGRCTGTTARQMVSGDGSAAVRWAAAHWVVALRDTAPTDTSETLQRCAEADPNGEVAALCASLERLPRQANQSQSLAHEVVIYVVPAAGEAPAPGAPYALRRPDALVHYGWADPAGKLVERKLPPGEIRLVALPD